MLLLLSLDRCYECLNFLLYIYACIVRTRVVRVCGHLTRVPLVLGTYVQLFEPGSAAVLRPAKKGIEYSSVPLATV